MITEMLLGTESVIILKTERTGLSLEKKLMVSLCEKNARSFVTEEAFAIMKQRAIAGQDLLWSGKGPGAEYLGWLDLPESFAESDLEKIETTAEEIRNTSDVFVVIGIGGSYLGSYAAISFLRHRFYNNVPRSLRQGPEIYFAGNHFSGRYLKELIEVIGERDVSVNVISKSGSTMETAVVFRFFRQYLEDRYGREEAVRRIFVTTDATQSPLKDIAEESGYCLLGIPSNVGGRFSVLTAVGLLPIAVSGGDIRTMLDGASAMRAHLLREKDCNDALIYAIYRNLFFEQGKTVELMACCDPCLHHLAEWWKQLFGESEGKNHLGLFPAAVDLTTDLHSLGQFIQDGSRIMFETVVRITEHRADEAVVVTESLDDFDGLNDLSGMTMDEMNAKAFYGSTMAHTDGGVPNLLLSVPNKNADSLGQLFYFYEYACGISGYVLGVNPFDQPGVEAYKRNMYALLGRKGYEEERRRLLERLQETDRLQ